MCNRHVAHMIAEYEAARLDEDEAEDDDSASPEAERTGLLATLSARFAR